MLRVIGSTLALQMKCSWVRPMFRFCLLANPVANTILLYEMFRSSGQENFAAYVILGSGLMGLWSCICFSSAGDINRERYGGTLTLLFGTPSRFSTILFGKILGNTLLSLLTLVISFGTAKLLYAAPVWVGSPWYFLLSLLAAIASFLAFSMIIAYLLTLSRKTEIYMNCIELPLVLLCGFVFPVESLPLWVRWISYALSPTWAVKLMRMSVAGVTRPREYFGMLGLLMVMTAGYFLLSTRLYGRVERQVRIRATLEVS